MLPRGTEETPQTRASTPSWGAFPKNLSLLAFSFVAYKCPGQHQLIQQVPSSSCSLPSLAEMVLGVWLENSVPQKLHFQNQILCFGFLVDHFQCLKHGLLPSVQDDHGWSSQCFLHSLEKWCSSWTTQSFNWLIPITPFFTSIRMWLFLPLTAFFSVTLRCFSFFNLSSTQKEIGRVKSWKRWK